MDSETRVVTLERVIAVDGLGTIVNPTIFEGQMLTASLQDYAMPRADSIPNFTELTHATPCLHNPLKAKGCAEVGSVGLPPAIFNAVLDVLAECGVTDLATPVTAARVWHALRDAAG